MWPLLASQLAWAITGGTAPDPADTSLDAVAALSRPHMIGQDPSHPNAQFHNWFCNAVLIDETTAVTASHCVGSGNYTLRFRRHVNGTLGTKGAGPSSYHHVDVASWVDLGHDLTVLTLAQNVSHIDPIPAITKGLHELTGDLPILHAGWGKEGPNFNQGPRNELLTCENWVTTASDTRLEYWSTAGNPNGCGVNMFDSGGAVLIEDSAGEWRLAGVHSTTNSAANLRIADGDPSVPHTPVAGDDLIIRVEDQPHIFASSGDTLSVDAIYENVGDGPVFLGTVDYYLSDSAISHHAGTVTKWLTSVVQPASLTLPTMSTPGTFRVDARIDESGAETEDIEVNNAHQSGRWLTVSPTVGDTVALKLYTAVGGADVFVLWVHENRQGAWTVVALDAQSNDAGGVHYALPDPAGQIAFTALGLMWTLDTITRTITSSDPSYAVVPASTLSNTGPYAHLRGAYVGAIGWGIVAADGQMVLTDGTTGFNYGASVGDLFSGAGGSSSFSWFAAGSRFQLTPVGLSTSSPLYQLTVP